LTTLKLLSLTLVLTVAPAFASSVYNLTIDTTSLTPGTTGFIDLAFNGGYSAVAVIDDFSDGGGSLDATSISGQGTVGTLPGEVQIGNDNADYDEAITFGSSIGFDLTFSGTPAGSIGDTFTLSFFNSDFSGGLLTGNVNDFWLAQFQLDTAGNITPTAYDNPSGGASFATITALPEPGTGSLVATALLAALVAVRTGVRRQAIG
jgi:hypothetical protein